MIEPIPAGAPVFMFSGQGAQKPGMGADLLDIPEVKGTFSCASDVLGYDVADLVLNADPDELNDTRNAQPALCVLSVGIARALMADPKVLLLDEPFSALDYKLRRAMQLEIKRLQRRLGITFVFVTHDQEEAFAMSDRVVVMNQGRIEQIGTPQEIYEEPSNLYVARFVGEINILPARIMSVPGEGIYIADISGRRFTLRTSRPFAAGDRVNVLLRPEDIRVYAHDDERPEGPYLTGRIEETVYKGATVDISIALDSGETLSVAEFFNEDDAEISYNRGERVAVTWVDGWEVVLPYEAD